MHFFFFFAIFLLIFSIVELEEKRFIETSKNSIQKSLNLIKKDLTTGASQTQTKSIPEENENENMDGEGNEGEDEGEGAN